MVESDYRGPPNAAPLAASEGARFVRSGAAAYSPVDRPARWWESMDGPELTRLINLATAHSPSFAQAQSQGQAQLTNAFVALEESPGLGWGAPPPSPPGPLARSGSGRDETAG